mgnify:CR=1 FL=1
MSFLELWQHIKDIFIDLVKYGFPTIAIFLSIFSYRDSRKANKVQSRLNELEEKLKKYELEEIEKGREEAKKARVEARIIKISKGNYKLKVWNAGHATAYNVDIQVPNEHKGIIYKDKAPFEFLEPGKNFEEHVFAHLGSARKFMVTLTWNDEKGVQHSKDQLLSI